MSLGRVERCGPLHLKSVDLQRQVAVNPCCMKNTFPGSQEVSVGGISGKVSAWDHFTSAANKKTLREGSSLRQRQAGNLGTASETLKVSETRV